jgi:hypothetical protein
MRCLFGQQEYWVAVQWRMMQTTPERVIVAARSKRGER